MGTLAPVGLSYCKPYRTLIVCIDEILLSSDKTVAVIDGSGVLADPDGLNREELGRLAKARRMISNFDKTKLGPQGYLVLVEDQDIKLPCKVSSSCRCGSRLI